MHRVAIYDSEKGVTEEGNVFVISKSINAINPKAFCLESEQVHLPAFFVPTHKGCRDGIERSAASAAAEHIAFQVLVEGIENGEAKVYEKAASKAL